MRLKYILVFILSAVVMTAGAFPAGSADTRSYRMAVKCYDSGLFERARTLLESLPSNPSVEGYRTLCALKMRSADYPDLVSDFLGKYPGSSLAGAVRFENGMIFFDRQLYAEALAELNLVDDGSVPSARLSEYLFKCGYCEFSLGHYPQAESFFSKLGNRPVDDFSAPGRYLSGIMKYNNSHFAEAMEYFNLARTDPRFLELSDYYIVDCEFNLHNYDATISDGEKIYDSVPKERKERLARMISESYLIKGDKEKARLYYDDLSREGMNRKDFFYAGSVMYSVEDYRGAIENFTRMTDRSDSLGQIANYHLANAYLRTRNQVAAMEAFLDAANVGFDPKMTEDAMFNYAKLAFDLNKDTGGFARYIRDYSTKSRGVQIYGYMALAALFDRDYAAAVDAYDKIDELDPDMLNNYTKANYLRAQQLVSNGSYRDAVPFLRASAYYLPKTNRFNQLSRFWMAESYYKTGNYSESAQIFVDLYNGQALYGMKEGERLAYNAAYAYFKAADYDNAARWFDISSSSSASDIREEAMLRRADCDFARHDYKAAVESYRKVMDEYGGADKVYPYFQQAISYGLSGNNKSKLAALRNIENATPGVPLYEDAFYELGRTYMDLKDNASAIRTFQQLKDSSKEISNKSRALIGLGMVNRNAKSYEKALECFKEVIALMPGSEYAEDALLAIESIYQAIRQPDKYLEYLEANNLAASKTDEEKARMYFNTGEQVYLAGNWQEAVDVLSKYLQTYPGAADAASAKFYLAESFRSIGDKEKSCEYYAEVMKSGSGSSFAEMSALRYSDLSYELERYQDAYDGYAALQSIARIETNKSLADIGMMRSAFKSRSYDAAIAAALSVENSSGKDDKLSREAQYVRAKSLLATSRRADAMKCFRILAADPSDPYGAESKYTLVQDLYDTGRFSEVEDEVYSFSQKAGDQSYWLAKAYVVLGDAFAEKGEYAQAKATFESIRDGYEPANGSDEIESNVLMRLEKLGLLMK